MADTQTLIELARQLVAWTGTPDDPVREAAARFVSLSQQATPQERSDAIKIIRTGGRKPVWQVLESLAPDGPDAAARISNRIAVKRITWGMTDYRDDILEMNRLAEEARQHGLKWEDLGGDYASQITNFVSNLIEISAMPEIAEADAAAEIKRLSDAIGEGETAALYCERGLVYFKQRDFNNALRDLNAALRMDYQNPEYHYQRGTAYAAIGDVNRAFDDYVAALSKNPNLPHANLIYKKINEWRNLRT